MGGSFEEMYEGTPPWDIGRPQPEFIRLEEAREIRGRVLDVGCGTGENALYLASKGHEVWGIDSAPTAIRKAKAKAEQRGLAATFHVHDALELHELGRTFDTVTDSGLFHTFGDEHRPLFAASLASILRRRGRYFMMCFSEKEPGTYGPRRVTQAEIRGTFKEGWRIEWIRFATFEANLPSGERAQAWLSKIVRP